MINQQQSQILFVTSDDDPDSYDDYGEVNNPFRPIWDGNEAQNSDLDEDPDSTNDVNSGQE